MSIMATVSIAAVLFLFSPKAARAAGKWSYEGEDGPERWAEKDPAYRLCKEGKRQAPIDVQEVLDVRLPPLVLEYPVGASEIVNDGHTIQINFPEGGTLKDGDLVFSLVQAHFHAPAENLLHGERRPFEAHFVHQNAQGDLAVLAVLYATGKENPGVAQLWRHMPAERDRVFPLPGGFDASAILPKNKDYIYFTGSLTTPPCSEGVRWYLLKESPPISEEQARIFSQAVGTPNNRPPQPVNARVVLD